MPPAPTPPRVVAVVVAYNRRDLLLEVLDALARQDTALGRIVVIDNASTDDSAAVAAAAGPLVDLVVLERNTGGAGGFAAGLAVALERHAPVWVWMMDDDTIPTASALTELLAAVSGTDAVVAGSRVIWTDGTDHPMNTPREKPFVSGAERKAAADRGLLAVRSSSFVSMLVRADIVRAEGLPLADYFIWNDDFEYSTRLLRGRRGVFVPGSVVVHKTRALASTDIDPGPRFYYEVRNKLWMQRASRSLNPGEKLLYGASTLRRWVRTFIRSADRAVLRDGLSRGLADGLRTRPRHNAVSLAGLGPVTDAVRALEGPHD
ncbi:Glycosyltransferase, GT2 family [Cryobacterium psychrotolerans]|uniref:Glycosyltransferase, GT2 family n=1 Tax=Cryobacterium psychrotolerans TaxID=386301 RepID=A0A1G9CK92_9MICO|nr:glycosyltransferase [Cryobacterium psychrotolerans]TFD84257.1 glycosyltransferase [Cryobacterium psychrotolerans]SDK52032.1 Glycosyltransferase, GT2 family [Cryobacterium psychrotolerans]